MDFIASSEDLDTVWQRRHDTDKEKNDKYMLYASSCIYHETSRACFSFLILDAKIPKFTSTCIKHVISKPSDTVLLCNLALNVFFVGFLVK